MESSVTLAIIGIPKIAVCDYLGEISPNRVTHTPLVSLYIMFHFVAGKILYRIVYNKWGFIRL
jgi:hypothetical protein